MIKKVFLSVSVVAAAVGVIVLYGANLQKAEERAPAAVNTTQAQGVVQAGATLSPQSKSLE